MDRAPASKLPQDKGAVFRKRYFLTDLTLERLADVEYVRLCPTGYSPVIVIDVDRADHLWEKLGHFPAPPDRAGLNQRKSSAQLIWFLDCPVQDDHPRAVAYLRAVQPQAVEGLQAL